MAFLVQKNYKIILASQSPRRRQLLQEAGFEFEVCVPNVSEDFPAEMKADDVAPFLAQKKANAARIFIKNENDLILAADSVVILENTIFNKPADYIEAFEMLRALSGKAHRVITGVCMLTMKKEVIFSGISHVFVEKMTDAEIDFYINTCRPFDKAGAYGIQEWLGHCKISRIEGTYTNVVGLPVDLIYKNMQIHFGE